MYLFKCAKLAIFIASNYPGNLYLFFYLLCFVANTLLMSLLALLTTIHKALS